MREHQLRLSIEIKSMSPPVSFMPVEERVCLDEPRPSCAHTRKGIGETTSNVWEAA